MCDRIFLYLPSIESAFTFCCSSMFTVYTMQKNSPQSFDKLHHVRWGWMSSSYRSSTKTGQWSTTRFLVSCLGLWWPNLWCWLSLPKNLALPGDRPSLKRMRGTPSSMPPSFTSCRDHRIAVFWTWKCRSDTLNGWSSIDQDWLVIICFHTILPVVGYDLWLFRQCPHCSQCANANKQTYGSQDSCG